MTSHEHLRKLIVAAVEMETAIKDNYCIPSAVRQLNATAQKALQFLDNDETPMKKAEKKKTKEKKSKDEIYRIVVLSTAHLTEDDLKLLTPEGPFPLLEVGKQSWVFSSLLHQKITIKELYASVFEGGWSMSLAQCCLYAWDRKCDYIRFDSDGPVNNQLEHYDRL